MAQAAMLTDEQKERIAEIIADGSLSYEETANKIYAVVEGTE